SRWAAALERLDDVVSAGALHLERVLLAATERAGKASATAVLFVGHGRDGFGGDGLRAPLTALRAARLRLSIIGPGSSPLAEAASLTGGEVVPSEAPDQSLPALLAALKPRPAPPATRLRGAGPWHPLTTITGQTVWLARALEAPGPTAGDGGVGAAARFTDLLALFDRARLPWREQDTGATALTPTRALLVLESAQDYRRFGIALPQPGGTAQETRGILGTLQRYAGSRADEGALVESDLASTDGALSDVASAIGVGYGVGGLGLVGTGTGGGDAASGEVGTIGGGGGRGAGGRGGRRARGPDVTSGTPLVRGTLDKEI